MDIQKLKNQIAELQSEKKDLSTKISNLKYDIDVLQSTIENETTFIEKSRATINSLSDTLSDCEHLLLFHQEESDNMSESISESELRMNEIDKELPEMEAQLKHIQDDMLCKSVLKVNKDNSYTIILKKKYKYNTINN
jgi:chromosome segregation ATPase